MMYIRMALVSDKFIDIIILIKLYKNLSEELCSSKNICLKKN